MFFGKMKKAKDPYTDFVTLRNMLDGCRNVKLKSVLAANPNLQSYLFEGLATDKHVAVRVGLASNRNLTEDVWKILEKDENEQVQLALKTAHPVPPKPRDPRSR